MSYSTRQQSWLQRLTRRWRAAGNEEGGALAFVLIIGASLLFVAALTVNSSMSGRRAAVQSTVRRAAFFCAEAGLDQARTFVANNYASNLNTLLVSPPTAVLNQQVCPNSAALTFTAFVRDNVDDGPPSNNNADVDGNVIIDVIAYQDGFPVAQVSSLVNVVSGQALMSNYTHQNRLGAQQTGTASK